MTELPTDAQFVSVPPAQFDRRALEELLTLKRQGALLHGDIKRVSSKYRVNYWTLASAYHRSSEIVHDSSVGTHRRIKSPGGKPENFDAHGQLYYQTLVLSEPHLAKIPREVLSRWGKPWYRELSHPDFTLRAFASGRCLVFAHQISWRESLKAELSRLWDPQAVSSFGQCLQVNGAKLELAVAIPGVPSGQHYEDKAGLVSIDTDHTPKSQGNVEIKVNIGEFDRRLSAMEQQITNLATSGGYLGIQQLKDQVFVLARDMRSMVSLFSSYLKAGSPLAAEGSNPSLSAAPPMAGSDPAGSEPAVQGILKPSVVYRRCPHLSQDGAMLRCEKTRPRMHVGDIEGYPANPVIIPKEEFFRGEKFVCRADFRSCPYFQGRLG